MMMNATHTIVSREMVKPSSPTPSHLRTYNLSETDQRTAHTYMPIILYYPNNEPCSLSADDKVRVLKKSLSQSLTKYYPFAGKLHTPTMPYIDCDDEGVVFVEAKNDSQMNMSQHISEENDTVGQLYVDGMFWPNSPHIASLVGVQVNHFVCGGIAVGVTLSHRVGDACTAVSFVSHWASVARYGSTDHKEVLPLTPHFIQSPATANLLPLLDTSALSPSKCSEPVTRKFVFPNSKLIDLKNKVITEGGSTLSIKNPTRAEVLTCLLYKTTLARASSFKPYFLFFPANMRSKFVPKLPQTTVGNYVASILISTQHETETSISVLVSKIKDQKIELDRVQNVQLVHQRTDWIVSSLFNGEVENVVNRTFLVPSFCGTPYHKFDFGWGNPAVASMTLRSVNPSGAVLMDTPNGDGIDAWVTLDKHDMERFQNDKELLSFCQN
ncbi:limonoid 21-O-acetyltransferse-like [Bidens hawaiensis]|uniref:limonoid 21-O-acetyltransferse-like n=1 Tax=Bidens hawaiensis TaxID=980011 RepID=UPI0040491918